MPADSPTPPDPRSRRPGAALALLAVLAAHGFLTFRLFPSWGALTDDERPVIVADHAIHAYHGALGARFLREHGTSWGFDPFFMAGYPETPVWDSSSNLAIAFQTAAGGRYSPRAYKLGLFACTLFAVAAIPAGALMSGLGRGEAAAAGAVGLVVFWAGFPAVLVRTGLFAFVTTSAALGPILGLLLRFDRRAGFGRWLALAAAAAAALFAHVTTPVIALGAGGGYAASALGDWRARRRRLGGVGLAAVAATAANAFWLAPLWRFRGIRTAAFSFMTLREPGAFWVFLVANRLDGRITLALLVLGALGLAAWWREGARCRALVFGGSAAVLLALCSSGGLWGPTRTLEPFRFLATLDLLLAVPAGSLAVRAAGGLSRLGGGGARGRWVVAAGVFLTGLGAWFAAPETVVFGAQQVARYRPLVVGLRPADRALVRWLREKTDPSARVLFEDQLRLLEPTDPESTHWTPLLPVLLGADGRGFVGGLYQTAFIAHHRAASFGDYVLGGRRVDAWTAAEFADYCDRYNVGWVVCWSPLSRFCVDRFPEARPLATLARPATPGLAVRPDEVQWRAIAAAAGPAVADRYLREGVARYKAYKVERPRSYFLRGRGRLTALDANRVELADVEPDADGVAVLSLHWLDTWKADPPVPLAPEPVPGDPVPFVRIRLDRPVSRLVLRNGY